jgi:hypothetical protein
MNDPQQISPRARMQELLRIPERLRTDAQWDELIELEILLAPGNRAGAPLPTGRQDARQNGGRQNNNRQNGAPRHPHPNPGRWQRNRRRGR